MTGPRWHELARPAGDSPLWELHHESCRLGRHDSLGAPAHFGHLAEGLVYETYPEIELPPPEAMPPGSGRGPDEGDEGEELEPRPLALGVLASLLGSAGARPVLLAPTGAPRPLEVYLHASYVEGLDVGLYHYEATGHRLRHLRRNDHSHTIAGALPDPRWARDAGLLLLLAAAPERVTGQWGERGYRLGLLEIGATARDLELRARSLGLGCRHLVEYRDRELDHMLDCDGLCLSIVHLLAVGHPADRTGSFSSHPLEGGPEAPGSSPETEGGLPHG